MSREKVADRQWIWQIVGFIVVALLFGVVVLLKYQNRFDEGVE